MKIGPWSAHWGILALVWDPFCFRVGAFFVTISSTSLFCEIHTAPTREQGFRDSVLSKNNSFLNVDPLIYRAVSGPPSQTSLLSILCWFGAKSQDFRVPSRTQWGPKCRTWALADPSWETLAALGPFLDPPWTLILPILGSSWAFLDRSWPPREVQGVFGAVLASIFGSIVASCLLLCTAHMIVRIWISLGDSEESIYIFVFCFLYIYVYLFNWCSIMFHWNSSFVFDFINWHKLKSTY